MSTVAALVMLTMVLQLVCIRFRYAGKLSKLYPEDPFQALLVDEIIGAIDDILSAIVPTLYASGEEKVGLTRTITSSQHQSSDRAALLPSFVI